MTRCSRAIAYAASLSAVKISTLEYRWRRCTTEGSKSGSDLRPYCRAMGALNRVGVVTQSECNMQCAEALCDDWFWLERLTRWN